MRLGSGDQASAIVKAIYDLAGGGPMLDLGCGAANQTRKFEGVWVDIEPRIEGVVNGQVVVGDAMDWIMTANLDFNLIILGDAIEHLSRADGEILLELIADKNILIFTPVGELWLKEVMGDSPHEHKSGWYPEEFFNSGWTVWEWPVWHRFPDGAFSGAFWAWNMNPARTVQEVAEKAGVDT